MTGPARPVADPRQPVADPRQSYDARLHDRRARVDALLRTEARISHARLAMFGLGAAIAVLWWRDALSAWWLIPPAAAFIVLLKWHDLSIAARGRAVSDVAFYERGLARLDDRWPGTGATGDRFHDATHPYANDLDLFGRGSLFELLSMSRTRSGERTLAAWLLATADISEIAERQSAVDELARALDLREAMWLTGADAGTTVDTDALSAWAESPPLPELERIRTIAATAGPAVLASMVYWLVDGSLWPLGVSTALAFLLFRSVETRVSSTIHAAAGRARDLGALSGLLRRLEDARFAAARLQSLQASLLDRGTPASKAIRGLQRLSEAYDWQESLRLLPVGFFLLSLVGPALAIAAVLVFCAPLLALAVQTWRRRHGTHVRDWVETVGGFEALSSLAAYRFEHPADPFPTIAAGDQSFARRALFDGAGLGHPLLPAATMVRNDVRLSDATRLLVVSGSNMSGKSTLLRTVGINAVLALAGAPVRADSLRLSPLALGATLRIQDSLQDGRSRFFAEITRIRALSVAADGPHPLLFLLDELFHGTNSHDRLLGASGVLRSLLDRGAAGLITTHDLALTAVADQLAPRAVNIHFEDHLENGEMRFDYRVKPGPVTHSNAVALMRLVGLEVG